MPIQSNSWNFYLVARFGNHRYAGAIDDEDTMFLVIACNLLEAAEVADAKLKKLTSEYLDKDYSNVVYEIGQADPSTPCSFVVMGPEYCYAYRRNVGNSWKRDSAVEDWVKFSDG